LEKEHTLLVGSPTRGGVLLDVDLVQPENSLAFYSIVQEISNHCGALLEVEWSEICRATQVEKLVQLYHTTDASGLQTFLRDKLARWAGNGGCMEEIWKYFSRVSGFYST
jgi:hypothetical protein